SPSRSGLSSKTLRRDMCTSLDTMTWRTSAKLSSRTSWRIDLSLRRVFVPTTRSLLRGPGGFEMVTRWNTDPCQLNLGLWECVIKLLLHVGWALSEYRSYQSGEKK